MDFTNLVQQLRGGHGYEKGKIRSEKGVTCEPFPVLLVRIEEGTMNENRDDFVGLYAGVPNLQAWKKFLGRFKPAVTLRDKS